MAQHESSTISSHVIVSAVLSDERFNSDKKNLIQESDDPR